MVQLISGSIVSGHGVASGCSNDPRFPEGTLSLQWPIFEDLGFNFIGYHRATINISVHPMKPVLVKSLCTFRNVKWHVDCGAEDFSFFKVELLVSGAKSVDGLIYWPHPETKPEHFQDPHVIEVVAPKVEGLSLKDKVSIKVNREQIYFH